MVMFWLLLVLAVATLGGVIAWLGDSVGRQIGRKHLRIFGLRPKTTGLLFAVGSGVLVALATFGTVSLLARSTVDNALRAPELQLELRTLKNNLKTVDAEYTASKQKLQKMLEQSRLEQQEFERVRSELEQRQQELTATAALNGRLDTRIVGLEAERNALGQQIKSKTSELEQLGATSQKRIITLRDEIQRLEAQRSQSSSQIQRLETQRSQLQNRLQALAAERISLEDNVSAAQTATEAALVRQRSLEATVAKLEVGRKNLEAQQARLEAQQAQLEAQRNQLQSEKNLLQTERNQLATSVGQLENQAGVLRAERSKLEGDIRELNETRASLEASVNRLEAQNKSLTQQLDNAEGQLRETREALVEATSGNFIFRQGDLVSQLLLESNSADVLREQLQQWLKQASQIAQIRGATRNKSVVLKPSPDLEPYIALAQKTKGADLVLMRTSRSVTQAGLELPVTLEVRPNEALFASGQPLRSREFVLGAARPNSSLRVGLESMMREVERDLLERGVPRENIPNPLIASNEVSGFLNQLDGISGSVWLAVAARRDLTPAGPVQVYFSLLR